MLRCWQLAIFQVENLEYLRHFSQTKGLKDTIVNWACSSRNGSSLEITSTQQFPQVYI